MSRAERNLKKTILGLVKDLSKGVFNLNDDEEDDMFKIKSYFEVMPSHVIASHIIREIIPHEDKIKARDDAFFRDNGMLFAGLSDDRKAYYLNIITTSERIEEEDKSAVWDYFDTILALAILCKKKD